METAAFTDMHSEPQAARLYRRAVLLADDAGGLQALDLALRRVAYGVSEVQVWLKVERFRAPAGTSLPYRGMARTEARHITNERLASAEADARQAVAAWGAEGRQSHVVAMTDVTPEVLADRLLSEQVDLIVSHGDGPDVMAAQAAARAGCPLLLVPTHGLPAGGASASSRHRAGGLIPTFHR